jgi:cystathionine beta-lyase/cystathionine gamma-synthase
LVECASIMYEGNERESVKIGNNFVRIAMGLEDPQDLINDLKQALEQ